jgi:hypothetical protein
VRAVEQSSSALQATIDRSERRSKAAASDARVRTSPTRWPPFPLY